MAKGTFLIQKEYELSIWGERREYYSPEGEEDQPLKGLLTNIEEYQIARIGFDGMNSPARARDIILKRNINGTNTLTFSLCSRYLNPDDLYDNFTSSAQLQYKELKTKEKYYENPFISYLTNETRLKLKFNNKWYDFIVKDIQEDSSNYMFHYTAQDLFINELSRSGYDIELSTELENNMGTSIELGQQILNGTDWKVEGEPIKQYIEEPVYRATAASGSWKNLETGEWETFEGGTTIYVFYSCIINQDPFFQCLKLKEGETELKCDSNNIIVNANLYAFGMQNNLIPYIYDMKYENNIPEAGLANNILTLEHKIRGKRLVRTKTTIYDEELDTVVQKMVYNGQEAYYYEDSYYQKEMFVTNMLGYNKDFVKISRGDGLGEFIQGWKDDKNLLKINGKDLELTRSTADRRFYNTSFFGSDVNNIAKRDYLICAIQTPILDDYYKNSSNKWLHLQMKQGEQETNLVEFQTYGVWNGEQWEHSEPSTTEPFSFYSSSTRLSNGLLDYCHYINTDGKIQGLFGEQKGIILIGKVNSKVDIDKSNLQLCFTTANNAQEGEITLSIRNIELFPFRVYWSWSNSDKEYVPNILTPNYEISASVLMENTALTRYNVFKNTNKGKEYLTIQVRPIWLKTGETYFVYDDSYAKITSIEAKESNRFNLIQNLCEKFECWANFNIEHDINGKISTEQVYIGFDENGQIQYYTDSGANRIRGTRQKKSVSFSEVLVPQKNIKGFKYGVNLNSITRTVNSDQISTFVIVKNNNNEFAKNGFCSIARASENYSGENSIINFDYYIQMGMLDGDMVYNDLYVHNPAIGQIGYYYSLKQINQQIDTYTEYITRNGAIIDELNAKYESLKTEYESLYSKYTDLLNEYHTKYGKTVNTAFDVNTNDYPNIAYKTGTNIIIDTIKKIIDTIRKYFQDAESVNNNLDVILTDYTSYKNQYEADIISLEDLIKQKAIIINKFRSKYNRFIQEGTWIDESYTDDNRYYLDALQVAHTSSKPQISYNITGIDISIFEGYEDYTFELGQITTIEDVNFFGYDAQGLPNQEEVVISEITYHLDSPEQNELVIQNYRTQWEDLFQRVAAEVQQLQYTEGTYARAAGIVNQKGEIKLSSLQSTIDNNNLTIKNAANQSVIWDDKGITVTSKTNADKILRIVNDGIYVSADGGNTYVNALRGDGISASLLNAGVINTSLITVANGNTPSFHWDSYGISAFKWEAADGDQQAFDLTTFVRFDQFGLYGIKDKEVDWHPVKLQDVVNEAHFSITWDGFSLKTGEESGIRITPEKHFIIYENTFDENKLPLYDDEGNRMYLVKVRLGIFDEQYTNKGNEIDPITYQTYGMKVESDGVIQLKEVVNTGYQNAPVLEQRVLSLISGSLLDKKMTLDTDNEYELILSGLINIHDSSKNKSGYPLYAVGITGASLGRYILTGTNLCLEEEDISNNSPIGYLHTDNGAIMGIGAGKTSVNEEEIFSVQIKIGEYNKNIFDIYSSAMRQEVRDPLSPVLTSFKIGVDNYKDGYIIFPRSGYLKMDNSNLSIYGSNSILGSISANSASFISDIKIENTESIDNPYCITIGQNGITIERRIETVNDVSYELDSVIGRQSIVYSLDADVVNSKKSLTVAGHGTFKNFYRNGKLRTGCFWYA